MIIEIMIAMVMIMSYHHNDYDDKCNDFVLISGGARERRERGGRLPSCLQVE